MQSNPAVKKLALIALVALLCSLSGGSPGIKQDYLSPYLGLPTAKGLEVYIWKQGNTLLTGLLPGTNMEKSEIHLEMLQKRPLSLADLKQVVKAYDGPPIMLRTIGNADQADLQTVAEHLGLAQP